MLPNLDTEHFYHPVKIPSCPFKIDQSLTLSPSLQQQLIGFLSLGFGLAVDFNLVALWTGTLDFIIMMFLVFDDICFWLIMWLKRQSIFDLGLRYTEYI